jgi:hypothetical protein
MATYFLHVKIFSRGNGSRATRAAAYRAGERIRDERTSAVYNYTGRTDVAHAEIVLPTEVADGVDLEWALDRSTLWNAAEHAGRLRNSRLAREILVYLQPELTPAQRTLLTRTFARELADRYRNAVDVAIHEPRPNADHRHHHAHLLMTTREVGPGGLGARTTLDLSGTERHERGLGPSKDELLWMRERWAHVTNEALREAGVAARVDHRSYKAQGIDREPQARIPQAVLYSERNSGRSTPAGDDIRKRHRERVEARLKGGEELARVIERQKAENRQRAIQSAERKNADKKTPYGALTREERNQRRREWYKANAERMNTKQREYRKHHIAQNAARRWAKFRQQQLERKPTQELDPARLNMAARGRAMTSPTAEESAKNWLAYRESQRRAESSRDASLDGPRDPPVGGPTETPKRLERTRIAVVKTILACSKEVACRKMPNCRR